jgi:Cytidylate kinase-like family
MPLVTLSASYGSGGSEVGPALARRLGVPFVDRAVSPELAHRLAAAENESRFWRLIRSVSLAGGLTAGSIHAASELDDRLTDRDALEAALREAAAGGDAVILGRAGALRDDPRALHVRLHGPHETPKVAVLMAGAKMRPSPTPITSRGGRTCPAYDESISSWAKRTIAIAASVMPVATSGFGPVRGTSIVVARRLRLVHQQRGGASRSGDRKQQVDVQAPAPRQQLREDAAEEQPDRGTAAGDRAVDPERLAALVGVGERRRQQRQRRRREQRPEGALGRPRGHEHAKLCAAPPIAEATAKPSRPPMNVHLRPNRSPSRPPNSSRLPNASARR